MEALVLPVDQHRREPRGDRRAHAAVAQVHSHREAQQGELRQGPVRVPEGVPLQVAGARVLCVQGGAGGGSPDARTGAHVPGRGTSGDDSLSVAVLSARAPV